MNSSEFTAYKSRIRATIRDTLSKAEAGRLDEAAFPAYSHPNPVINWLFWQRLRRTIAYVETQGPLGNVLDFGCGSGVLLPFLAQRSQFVLAADIDTDPLERMRASLSLPESVHTLDLSKTALSTLPPRSFDLVTALDVLEHVDNLPETLESLLSLLKPGGKLVVSGPTENIFYRIGRQLAGKEYSGHYHERGIAEIRRELGKKAQVDYIATLYWPVPLFEIFAGIAPTENRQKS